MTNYITKTIKNGVEANIPVTSVNWQYGDVVVAWKEYHAGKWIEIWTYNDYSAMQWPAPDGFHVPQSSEWQAVYNILITTFWLATNDTTMGTYLKMPMAWYRNYSDASINSGNGRYWSSSKDWTWKSSYLRFYSTALFQEPWIRSGWNSIRAFKDTPIIPDNSWTTLYDWSSVASGAWIFYNATDGLISVSGDGTNWYTIQDKNLWATTVYNQWDTVNNANSWYFYQWGNNYGFAHSWTVTTSQTQVNANTYWPWNYYSSSTFITRSPQYSSSPYNWDSSNNDNLWWWETWVVTLDNAITNTGVLSVNGQTGDVVLSAWDVMVSTQPNNILTSWMKIWAWTESNYQNLGSYDQNTVYLTI